MSNPITILLGGVDITLDVPLDSLTVVESGCHQRGEAEFDILDADNSIACNDYAPVTIYDANESRYVHSGLVLTHTDTPLGLGRVIHIATTDLGIFLDQSLVPGPDVRPVESDKTRITYLLATYGPQLPQTLTYVSETNPLSPATTFANMSLRTAIEATCSIATATTDYWIGGDGLLHYGNAAGGAAPFKLRANGALLAGEIAPEPPFSIDLDPSSVINAYYVRGKNDAGSGWVTNPTSITYFAGTTGLAGRFEAFIDAPDADTGPKRDAVGNAALSETSYGAARGKFRATAANGWVPGQTLTIKSAPQVGIVSDTTAKIVKVTRVYTAGGSVKTYDIEFGAAQANWSTTLPSGPVSWPGGRIAPGSLGLTPFASTIRPVPILAALPSLPDAAYPDGCTVVLTTDHKLYRNDGGTWSKAVDGGDITADTITAASIAAGAIGVSELAAGAVSADKLAAILLLASLIKTAASGSRVEMDTDGIRLYDASDVLLVRIPTDGSSVYVAGDIQASTLTMIGEAEVRGVLNFAKNSQVTLEAGVAAPSSAPNVAESIPVGQTFVAAGDGWTRVSNFQGYYDAAGGASGATACYVGLEKSGASFRVVEWKVSDGSRDRVTNTDLTGSPLGMARVGTLWFFLGYDSRIGTSVRSCLRTTGVTAVPYDIAPDFFNTLNWDNRICSGGGFIWVVGHATSNLTLRVVKYNATMTPTKAATVALTLPTAPGGASNVFLNNLAYADQGDGSGACFFGDIFWYTSAWISYEIQQWSLAGALVANHSWPNGGGDYGAAIWWDGSAWWHLSVWQNQAYKYTGWYWTTATGTLKYWIAYAWYDDVGTVHETAVGPRRSIDFHKRRQMQVITPPIPTGGVDDADKIRIYALQNATDPTPGTLKLQATDALTSRILVTYDAAGAADGAGTAFAAATGAILQSVGTSIGWELRGDGAVFIGGVQVTAARAAVLQGDPDTAWHVVGGGGEPAFANSWVNFGGAGNLNAEFRKDAMGYVHLGGFIKSGTLAAAAFTLPAGYRPAGTERFAVISNSLLGQLVVANDGTVKPYSGSNASFDLSGVTFLAEA